jgi:hypothetical protein
MESMTTDIDGADVAGQRNKGQSLVAAFRAARIAQRPALRAELKLNRAALRQERTRRLVPEAAPETASAPAVSEAPAAEEVQAGPRPEIAAAQAACASIFAAIVGAAEARPDIHGGDAAPEPVAEQVAEAAEAAAEPAEAVAPKLPLSTIGFGPGMMIRLSQLGIESVAELAAADPQQLRNALGDISQLVNVDLWIASARHANTRAA